jgi:two-component system alkaline phosphatase synthesis response regulator PhoP
MPKVLVVEDEPGLQEGLAHNLRFEGYEVVAAGNGREGLRLALKERPDLIVLDIMLPEKDGFQVLKEFRLRNTTAPVLILTARSLEADLIKGFDLGADDYMTKPFSVAELMARVRALLKRAPTTPEGEALAAGSLSFGDVVIDTANREVRKAGELVPLAFKEFELMKFLVQRRGKTVSREELLSEIWGVDPDIGITTRTVDTHIANLRNKLGGGGVSPNFIATVHKVGYKFVG